MNIFISSNHVNNFQLLLGNIDYIDKLFRLYADPIGLFKVGIECKRKIFWFSSTWIGKFQLEPITALLDCKHGNSIEMNSSP